MPVRGARCCIAIRTSSGWRISSRRSISWERRESRSPTRRHFDSATAHFATDVAPREGLSHRGPNQRSLSRPAGAAGQHPNGGWTMTRTALAVALTIVLGSMGNDALAAGVSGHCTYEGVKHPIVDGLAWVEPVDPEEDHDWDDDGVPDEAVGPDTKL